VWDQVKAQQRPARHVQAPLRPHAIPSPEKGLGVQKRGPGIAALAGPQALDAAPGVLNDEDADLAPDARIPPGEGGMERERLVVAAWHAVEAAEDEALFECLDRRPDLPPLAGTRLFSVDPLRCPYKREYRHDNLSIEPIVFMEKKEHPPRSGR
jgi:hypothetical protein